MAFARPRSLRFAIVVAAAGGALVASRFASARDDFLRATSRDLSPREKVALEARIAELGNPDPNVRVTAVRMMAAIGAPARPALLAALEKASDAKLVRNVCLALGALQDVTSLSQLERWFLAENRDEEPSRAALLALARARTPMSPELAERVRRLMLDAPIPTVRESALLCAGFRRAAGLPDLLKTPLQNERVARIRGCMLVALAECGDPDAATLILPFLDSRKVRDEVLRRAALYAVARIASPVLHKPLLAFEPDQHEVAACVVALGAFADPPTIDRLGALLIKERERAAGAVLSLAHAATPEAKQWLTRALAGEFSDRVRAEAALAVADMVDQQRFLPALRQLAAARLGDPAKSPAILALARIGDVEAAATVAEALPLWKDRELLERGLLLCARTLDRPVAELLPLERADPVLPLWHLIAEVQTRQLDPRILEDAVADALTAARAHWTLAVDDLRMATLRELLELDKLVRVEPRDGDGSSPPGDGSGGGGTGGGGTPPPPDGSGGTPPPPPPPGGNNGGSDPGLPRARGKPDTARIELDLRQWLIDFPPFELADPFAR